ncbi:MAG: hypothetical protein HY226_01460 [Candidatus Vogelbacteria bacterium]|nr:hypothetical protein [Candidatus Vogelbacteria bacterium]
MIVISEELLKEKLEGQKILDRMDDAVVERLGKSFGMLGPILTGLCDEPGLPIWNLLWRAPAQVFVTWTMRALFEKRNGENKIYLTDEIISDIYNEPGFIETLKTKSGTESEHVEEGLKTVKEILLMSDIFSRPLTYIFDITRVTFYR